EINICQHFDKFWLSIEKASTHLFLECTLFSKEHPVSTHTTIRRTSVPQIRASKGKGRIVSLTAYTSLMAKLMDDFVDLIVVGDSTGMVAYGMESTLQVTLEMMINHGK